jgi:hypothetical protein
VLVIWLLNFVTYFLIVVFKWRDDHTQLVLDLLSNQECLWNVNRKTTETETFGIRHFFFYFFFLKCVDILSLNSHILQQHLPAQVTLPPFWNRLPRSLLWNRVNSIVQPLNSISLIRPRWSTWGTRVNAALLLNTYVWKMEMDTVTSLGGLNLVTVTGRIKLSHIDFESEKVKL